MLIFDLKVVGNRLYTFRKAKGLTQAQVAEMADLSDRAYADIERGDTAMRINTFMKICRALQITPNDVLLQKENDFVTDKEIFEKINDCSACERETALQLLKVYINSLK